MVILNFSHPLTKKHLEQIETLTGRKIERVIEINSQIDSQKPLMPQVVELVERAGLSPAEWQTLPLLINPPSLNFIAVAFMAHLHGRCGYFPAVLRLKPVVGSLTPQFEVAEVLDLQAIRDRARQNRV